MFVCVCVCVCLCVCVSFPRKKATIDHIFVNKNICSVDFIYIEFFII